MPIQDVRILGQKDTTQFIDGGKVLAGVETRFMVGPDGPFSVFLTHEDFTPERNRVAIEEKADKVRGTRAAFTPQS